MAKKMLIDATHPEETRVVVADGTKVDEFDFESLNKRQLAGNIYLAKVTRVEPSLQAAFVEYGGNRHGFLAFSEIHPDYYQIPVADREALLAEEEEAARRAAEEEDSEKPRSRRGRRRSSAAKDGAASKSDATATAEVAEEAPAEDTQAPAPEAETAEAAEASEAVTEAPVEDAPAEVSDAPTAEAADDTTPAEEAKVEDAPAEETAEKTDADAPSEPAPEGDDAPEEAELLVSEETDEREEESDRRRRAKPRRYKIQEVVKVRQIMLVQVVKEERGNKGAALTTYLSLAGRYCVLMPNTARGGGISRKITSATDRKKLKQIAGEIEVPKGAGLIIRTAGAKRTRTEIKRDYEYLIRQWEMIRDVTMKSVAPTLIYEEGSLIKRSIRDLYGREIDEVFVEGAEGYREAKDYMKMLMPSHAKNVKLYSDPIPLFARYQVENYLGQMFNPTVQLKSGGYIVIGITEALVAIDVNSGRATKEGSIEETATKTNLEAADEVARQLRLRDLAGLIVIDFIDMDERKNNAAVEKRMKEALKADRARIQVGRISSFGLMEMSRQRLRPGMLETITQPCPHCHGTGHIRSDDSLALTILRELEEEGVRQRCKEMLLTAPTKVANYLLNQKRDHVMMIESRYGIAIRVEGDPLLVSPDHRLERFKTATRVLPSPSEGGAVQVDGLDMLDEAELESAEAPTTDTPAETDGNGEGTGKRKRKRRRRGRGKRRDGEAQSEAQETSAEDQDAVAEDADITSDAEATEAAPEALAEPVAEAEAKPKSRRSRSVRRKKTDETETPVETAAEASESVDTALGPVIETDPAGPEEVEVPEADVQKPKARSRRKPAAKKTEQAEQAADVPADVAVSEPVAETPAPEPVAVEEVAEVAPPEPEAPASEPEPVLETVEATSEPAAPPKPKKRGWWSRG
ncbi:MAG: ribonuclease E/G [Pseudomonadota bacterium]